MAREGKSKGRIITPKATQEITILFYKKKKKTEWSLDDF